MGSPLSPILADIVMDDLETNCLRNLNFTIHTYYRYVDDIFLIIPMTKIIGLLTTFNSYHPRLKFTYEVENNNSLSFLDVLLVRSDNMLISNWYRKSTFSGRYINFYSNHPPQYKLNTITNLVDHAILLSDAQFHKDNIRIVKDILGNNGYPKHIINKRINDRCKNIAFNKEKSMSKEDNKGYTLMVPFVDKASHDLKRILKNLIDVRFTIPKKLNCLIKKGKDQLNKAQVTEVVYKLNCKNCDKVYIGQTKRHLGTRVKEHLNNIKSTSNNYSVVSNHRLLFNHDFQWDKPNILHKERNRNKREIAEMFLIKKHDNNINLQKDTENLNSIYNKLLTL